MTALFVAFGLGCSSPPESRVALARRRIGPRLLRAVDGVAGAGVLTFGGLLAYRTLRD